MKKLKFFFPINCRLYDNDFGDEYDVDQGYLHESIGDVYALLEKEQDLGDSKLVDFYLECDGSTDKVKSIRWDIERIEGKYYGCAVCELSDSLNKNETDVLRDWITGQNSDGFGEGFEQRPVSVEEGELYVSFWNSGKGYFVDTEQEFAERRHPIAIIPYSTTLLRKLKDIEGLVIQGCGGDRRDWVRGINQELRDAEIFRENTCFSAAYVFNHNGLTNLMFPFEDDVKLDMGKFAMWRLNTHPVLHGTWFSDYVSNQLGGFIEESKPTERIKPDCALIGEDGNIFNLMGIASRTLKENDMENEAKEMCDRIQNSGSYYEALAIIGEYVNITDGSEDEEIDFEQSM